MVTEPFMFRVFWRHYLRAVTVFASD